jgi:hypothetical protein
MPTLRDAAQLINRRILQPGATPIRRSLAALDEIPNETPPASRATVCDDEEIR